MFYLVELLMAFFVVLVGLVFTTAKFLNDRQDGLR